jgi:predicted nucleic-acid-binding Zn-ribbon protein
MAQPSCPKCTGLMEEGFILDVARQGYGQATWVQGPPEPSFWAGLKLNAKTRRPVVALRCSRCGYLESYAQNTLPARQLVRGPFLIAGVLLLIGVLLAAGAVFLMTSSTR